MKILIEPVLGSLVVAEPAVETGVRFEARGRAMPLADQRGAVAGLVQEFWKKHLVRQPVAVEIRPFGEKVMDPVLRGESAGQEAGPCRRAHW